MAPQGFNILQPLNFDTPFSLYNEKTTLILYGGGLLVFVYISTLKLY